MNTQNTPINVAFIGLGMMGMPMASRLVTDGYKVVGFDLSDEAKAKLVALGASSAESPRKAAENADIVVLMLPNGSIVRDALFDTDGALQSLPKGGLVIDMSSSAPTDTLETASSVSNAGYRFIDAPVSGGVKRAVDGSLTIMAGGSKSDIAEASGLLGRMGANVIATGIAGSGHAMKALNNYVSAAGAVAAMEALVVGKAFGLDPSTMVDILNVSTGRNNTTELKMKQFVLSETFASGFAMALMAKDVRIAANLAESLSLNTPGLAAAANLWEEASSDLGKGADHTEIMKIVQKHAAGKVNS